MEHVVKNESGKLYSLSVILITKNEEDRIERCLKSVLSIADELVVLDSGSSDQTVEIAKEYTEKVFETDWPGYGPQKQRALEKAGCEWVLSIDADEALSTELSDEIHRVLSGSPKEIGYKLPWAVTIFGKTLNHGRSARAPLRLFKREGAGFSPAKVHEKILLPKGKIKTLKGRLFHYTHRDFEHTLFKNADYAWLGAKERYAAGKKGWGLPGATFRAVWVFFQVYVIRGGFLDGSVGFLMAVIYSQVTFNKYAGLWSLYRQDKLNNNNIDN
ncbi:MAG: glycosyltransferase family 2 protein [Desulfobacteraceae bacterium]|nr:glycosyltransferase family 2 protein [Desulfobacteraceae bacterium]MBC2754882.1 glycosyltransferase family 2 protein [Desulfobacteraceae bacterium]